jgi:hypothetical protein
LILGSLGQRSRSRGHVRLLLKLSRGDMRFSSKASSSYMLGIDFNVINLINTGHAVLSFLIYIYLPPGYCVTCREAVCPFQITFTIVCPCVCPSVTTWVSHPDFLRSMSITMSVHQPRCVRCAPARCAPVRCVADICGRGLRQMCTSQMCASQVCASQGCVKCATAKCVPARCVPARCAPARCVPSRCASSVHRPSVCQPGLLQMWACQVRVS